MNNDGIEKELEDLEKALEKAINEFETFGLVDELGNDVETSLGELFEGEDLVNTLKPIFAKYIQRIEERARLSEADRIPAFWLTSIGKANLVRRMDFLKTRVEEEL